jgi:hypothetical protein
MQAPIQNQPGQPDFAARLSGERRLITRAIAWLPPSSASSHSMATHSEYTRLFMKRPWPTRVRPVAMAVASTTVSSMRFRTVQCQQRLVVDSGSSVMVGL